MIEKHGLRFSQMHTAQEEKLILLEARALANAGTTYRIAVDSKNGQAGPYVLELR